MKTTVEDILSMTTEYQDFILRIYDFGGIPLLFDDYIPNGTEVNEIEKLKPLLDKEVSGMKFSTGLLKLYLR